MLDLQSYRNFVGNTYYYLTELGYKLANKLKIGACGIDKYKQDLSISTMLLNTIGCYDYPFEFNLTALYTTSNSFVGDDSIFYATRPNIVGLPIFDSNDNKVATCLSTDIGDTLDPNKFIVYTDTDMSAYDGEVLTISNTRNNCLQAVDFSKVVDLINKINGTSYCVDVTNPNVEVYTNIINQGSCTYTISPMTMNISNLAQQLTITIATDCQYIASVSNDWLSILGDNSGVGNGFITVYALANPTAYMRTGVVTISGISIIINQDPIDY